MTTSATVKKNGAVSGTAAMTKMTLVSILNEASSIISLITMTDELGYDTHEEVGSSADAADRLILDVALNVKDEKTSVMLLEASSVMKLIAMISELDHHELRDELAIAAGGARRLINKAMVELVSEAA
jgi:hypothetical protein